MRVYRTPSVMSGHTAHVNRQGFTASEWVHEYDGMKFPKRMQEKERTERKKPAPQPVQVIALPTSQPVAVDLEQFGYSSDPQEENG